MHARKIFVFFFFIQVFLLCAAGPAAAQQGGEQQREPAVEQEILDRLAAVNPEAVPVFQKATQEMDAGDHLAAQRDYLLVLELAPDFPDAERRLGYVESALGNSEAALAHTQRALDIDPSPVNHFALASLLILENNPAGNRAALDHAKIAAEGMPGDFPAQILLTITAMNNEEYALSRQANARALALAPDNPLAHYCAGLLAAQAKQWETAEKELLLSKELGMPDETIQEMLDSGVHSQALIARSLRWGGYSLAAWLGGFLALLLVGSLLSWVTLKAVQQPDRAAEQRIGSLERLVRSIYRGVIALSSVYFYLSIPLLILVVVGAAGGVIYLFFVIGQVPIRLVVFIGLFGVYTLYVVFRSIFTRIKDEEPGRPLQLGEAPAMWHLAKEVAEKVGTRPVDAIYITPGAEIAVTERGGLLKKLRGLGQRCLILGLGALPGMNQGQLKSILAHEYGHFSNRDTAGGNFAQQVLVSLNMMGLGLAVSGLAKWYNPAWLFVNGFHRVFLRITLGASRLQEILADRYAALAYGVRTFVDGMTHVIRQSVLFNYQVSVEVKGFFEQGSSLHNLYTLPSLPTSEIQQEAEQKMHEALNKETNPYDSHPSFKQRLKLLEGISSTAAGGWSDQDPAWDLLPRADALQDEMTAVVQENLNRRRAQMPPTSQGAPASSD